MTRRRFLRVTSLTLLILCLAAWGWSYFCLSVVGYHTTATTAALLQDGRFTLIHGGAMGDHSGWNLRIKRRDPEVATVSFTPLFLGIEYTWSDSVFFGSLRALSFPMWIPSLCLAVLTFWTWRKRRAKDGRGFAVDGVGEQANESAREGNAP